MKTKAFFCLLLCLSCLQGMAQVQATGIEAIPEPFSIPASSRLRVHFEKSEWVDRFTAISIVVVGNPDHPGNGTWAVIPTESSYVTTSSPQVEGFWDFVAYTHLIVHVFDYSFEFNAPLPVDLLSFQATVDPPNVQLAWTAAAEVNFDRYIVEHSQDAFSFAPIAETVATGQGGTYLFIDPHPTAGTHYYRLKLLDLDGSFTYSDVVTVQFLESGNTTVYPNPTSGRLFVDSDEPQPFVLFNAQGQKVAEGSFEGELDLSHLIPGYYCLRFEQQAPILILLQR